MNLAAIRALEVRTTEQAARIRELEEQLARTEAMLQAILDERKQ